MTIIMSTKYEATIPVYQISWDEEEEDTGLSAVRETLIKALPRQGECEKTLEYQHVKPKALMLI